ncbi:MAG: hypothetical protein ACTHJ8_12365 [Mucilaginibacter sp.]
MTTKIKPGFLTKISSLPKHAPKKDTHYWADYLELLCLFNKDSIVSQNDFIDRLNPRKDLEDNQDTKRPAAEQNDANNVLAEDVFALIAYRFAAFKEYYPFKISEDQKTLHAKKKLSIKHKIYLFLLFSSSLGIFQDYTSILTSSFEHLSLAVLRKMLPQNAKAVIFGSSNIESAKAEKTKNEKFWKKLNKLANDLKERVIIEESTISDRNRGDGGLDLYSWFELGDENRHFPMIFCQCACTPDWVNKQHSSKFDSWNEYLTFATYPLNMIFVPYSFRRANGEWHEPTKIAKSILMDRQRLLYLLGGDDKIFERFKSFELINQVMDFKEAIV